MRRNLWVLALPLIFAQVWVMSPALGLEQEADTPKEVPKEVRAMEGTYTGSWLMYGIDKKGEIIKSTAWTDTMEVGGSEIEGDRAFVSTIDEMTFEGDQIPPFKVQGKEGYYLRKDGGLGAYFIETAGQMYRMVKVGENVWSYTTPAATQELSWLGFPENASGQHVLVKVVTNEQGVETHRISRLTTVNWKDNEGKEQVLQFVSLQGYHRRQL
ncbi:hypothetical protein ACFLT2_02345 [Acidobacteriota bacterium]